MIKGFRIVLGIFLIISCETITYSLEEKNFVEVDPPTFNDVYINLLSPTDTLGMWGETTLRYNLNLGKKIFSHIMIYIDDKMIVNTSDINSTLINTKYFEDGIHTLRFEVFVFANSNSIADRLKIEMAIVYKNIPILIDNAPPESILIDDIIIENGQPKIIWKKYKRLNFQEYHVYRGNELVSKINSANKNFYYDPLFIGGHKEYRVSVKAANKTADGPFKSFSDTLYFNDIKINDKNRLEFSWSKSKFYKNFTSYKIIKQYNTVVAEIKTIDSTTYIGEEIPFGIEEEYYIVVASQYLEHESNKRKIFLGKKMPNSIEDIYYDTTNDAYFFKSYDRIVKYDSQLKNKLAESTNYINPKIISYSNNRLFTATGSEFFELDPSDLSIIWTIPTSSFWSVGISEISLEPTQVAYTNDNKILFTAGIKGSITLYDYKTMLVDLETPEILAEAYSMHNKVYINYRYGFIIDTTSSYKIIDVSDDGRYAFLKNLRIYDLASNSFARVYNVGHTDACFDNKNSFIEVNNNTIIIRNNIDGSINATIPVSFSSLRYPQVDPVSNLLGGVNDGNFIVYDISSQQILKTIKIPNWYNDTFGENIHFLNSTLFSRDGLYLPLRF